MASRVKLNKRDILSSFKRHELQFSWVSSSFVVLVTCNNIPSGMLSSREVFCLVFVSKRKSVE